MEIPIQYKAAVEFGILGRTAGNKKKIIPRPPPVPYTHRAPTHEPSGLSAPAGDERSEMLCPICLTNGKDIAFGCGQMSCRDCAPRLSDCPICSQPIRSRLRVFTG